jgi:hypothetical protein
MKKQIINLILSALVMSIGMPMIAKESKAVAYGIKTAKVAWHVAEIFAGYKLLRHDFYWAMKDRGTSNVRRFVYGVGSASLLVHGIFGLNKEFEISKHLGHVLTKSTKKAITA